MPGLTASLSFDAVALAAVVALKISLVNEAAAGAAMPMVADAKKRRPANGRPRCRATALPAAANTQVRKRRAAMTSTNRDSLRACDGWSLRLKVNVDAGASRGF